MYHKLTTDSPKSVCEICCSSACPCLYQQASIVRPPCRVCSQYTTRRGVCGILGTRKRGIGMKILWVEDDAVIAGAVADFLAGKGCAVTHCPTLAAAQQAIQAASPELVLLGWNLPDGACADFCRALRSRFPALPLLLLTVRSDTADVLAGFACGADDYVTKPFELEILYSRIEALWRRCGHRDNAGSLLQCGGIALDEA